MLNQEKIGKFIADRRKKRGVTQKQLAEQLGVSDKAVSKWENGRGMPDNSILMELCDSLGINVNELLSGEELSDDNYHGKAEENMVNLIEQSENERKRGINILISGLVGTVILLVVLIGITYMSSGKIKWYLDIPSLIIITIITAIVLLMSGLAKDFVGSFAMCVGKKAVGQEQLIRAIASHKLVLFVMPLVGFIVSIVGAVAIFGNAVKSDAMGLNFSVALLAVLYGLALDLLLLPVTGRLWAMYRK